MSKISAQDPEATPTLPVVVYAAKSTEDVHGSIPTQIEHCHAAVAAEGGREVVAEERDDGVSAFKRNRGPGLERAKVAAVGAAERHGSAELWVQHSDRLARGDGLDADHLAEIFFAMRRLGVRLRSVQDDHNLEDAIRAVLIGDRNHEDSGRKSKATRDGKRRRYERGEAVGGPVNDGYKLVDQLDANGHRQTTRDGRLLQRRVLDPVRAPIIRRMMEAVESGMTPGDVARMLNGEGVRTRLGKSWNARSVRGIVTNGYYVGLISMHGATREAGEDHERLLERDQFERVQAALTRMDPSAVQRRKGGRRPVEDYLLRGVAFCPRCDGALFTRRYASGRHYICHNVREATGLCDAPRIPADRLEAGVLSHLDEFMPSLAGWIQKRVEQRQGERAKLERALDAERKAHAALVREIANLEAHSRRHYQAGDGDLAAGATRLADQVCSERDQQAEVVDRFETRLSEWSEAPDAVDAALEFFTEVRDLIVGRIKKASSAVELNAALGDLLVGVWADVDAADTVRARVVLREVDGEVPAELALLLRPSLSTSGEGWPEFMADGYAAGRREHNTLV